MQKKYVQKKMQTKSLYSTLPYYMILFLFQKMINVLKIPLLEALWKLKKSYQDFPFLKMKLK